MTNTRMLKRHRDAELAAQAKGKKTSASKLAFKKEYPLHIKIGDMVFENAVLFIHDALLTREFSDAIKKGDSGWIVLVLKQFTFGYRAMEEQNMRTRCCTFCITLHVILHNWVLNPTGKHNTFVEVDLKFYKADGDAHSWDWLAFVSPCVDVLHQLAVRFNEDLGARQGNKHTILDLTKDIQCLMANLQEHEVYIVKEGCVLDDDEMPALDVLSTGAAALTHGAMTNPIEEFNDQFDQLRRRRRLIPVADLLHTSCPHSPVALASPAESDGLPDTIIFFNGNNLTSEPLGGDDLDDGGPPVLVPPTPPASDDEEGYDEDLFAQSPTLTRLETANVDLDMDDNWVLDGDYDSASDYDGDKVPNDEMTGSESD
ncbi:hypothetical protein B0H10DRAFT_1943992 [Mycena sp. CBHHK59/15]|nr:hypothetical protein B0H10DRAFT_1943992 [Mycena sp. CBHHK59/15]